MIRLPARERDGVRVGHALGRVAEVIGERRVVGQPEHGHHAGGDARGQVRVTGGAVDLLGRDRGDAAVRGYYTYTRTAFPDQDHEIIAVRHSADAVIVEFWLMGTHRGYLGKVPPTGSRFRVRMTAYFVFDDTETLVCERIYFDTLTMIKQLRGGLDMKKPTNWLLAARCVRGLLSMSSEKPDPALTNTVPPALAGA